MFVRLSHDSMCVTIFDWVDINIRSRECEYKFSPISDYESKIIFLGWNLQFFQGPLLKLSTSQLWYSICLLGFLLPPPPHTAHPIMCMLYNKLPIVHISYNNNYFPVNNLWKFIYTPEGSNPVHTCKIGKYCLPGCSQKGHSHILLQGNTTINAQVRMRTHIEYVENDWEELGVSINFTVPDKVLQEEITRNLFIHPSKKSRNVTCLYPRQKFRDSNLRVWI
jgi:hypothetical protein